METQNFERGINPKDALNIGMWHKIPIPIQGQLLNEAKAISDDLKESGEVNLRGLICKSIEEIEKILYDFYEETDFIEDPSSPESFEGRRAPNEHEVEFIIFKIKELQSKAM